MPWGVSETSEARVCFVRKAAQMPQKQRLNIDLRGCFVLFISVFLPKNGIFRLARFWPKRAQKS